jgi:hypothetical protein
LLPVGFSYLFLTFIRLQNDLWVEVRVNRTGRRMLDINLV